MDRRTGLSDYAFIEGLSAFSPEAEASDSDDSDHEDHPCPRSSATSPTLAVPATQPSDIDLKAAAIAAAKARHNKAWKEKRKAKAVVLVASGGDSGSAFGRNPKLRRLLEKGHTIAMAGAARQLPHSAQDYLGPQDSVADEASPGKTTNRSRPRTQDPRDAKLEECYRKDYVYVKSEDVPEAFVDDDGTIPIGKAGVCGDRSSWNETVRGVSEAFSELDRGIFGTKSKATAAKPSGTAGLARGTFRCAHFGYSFGGGQGVRPLPMTSCVEGC